MHLSCDRYNILHLCAWTVHTIMWRLYANEYWYVMKWGKTNNAVKCTAYFTLYVNIA